MSKRFPTLVESQSQPPADTKSEEAEKLEKASAQINTVLRECERLQAENAKLRERYDGLIKAHNKLVDDLKEAKKHGR